MNQQSERKQKGQKLFGLKNRYVAAAVKTLLLGAAGGGVPPISEWRVMWPSKAQVETTDGLRGHHLTSKFH